MYWRKRFGAFWLLAAAVVGVWASAAAASDEGQTAANQVSEASYRSFLGDNQGVPGILYARTGYDRLWSAAHDLARANIAAKFQQYGLTVELDPFTYSSVTYYNVVATKVGTSNPYEEYIIGAHYDSVACPGADDNGSGVSLVLEAARIISQYPSDYTIRFIAFDREEQGLVGSNAYAIEHAADTIRGMISADMVAYDTGGNRARMYGRTASNPIKNALGTAITMYSGGLTYTIYGQLDASDHAPFEGQGWQACVLIEEYTTNPNYHTIYDSVDTPNYINYPYAVKMTRSVVGWLVDAAGVRVPTLGFAYPNGRPAIVAPGGGTQMRVVVSGINAVTPQPGTGVLYYNTGGGWQSAPMTVVSPNVYDAVFPAAACGTTILYYVSAQAVGGTTYNDPRSAPTATYSTLAASGTDVIFADDFEVDRGWTVGDTGDTATTGTWNRADPQGTTAQPEDDHTPPPGVMCWVTDSRAGTSAGQYDVDGGKTTVKSPTINLSNYNDAVISYWRWYSNDKGGAPGADTFVVDISNNNGSSWVNVETVGPSGAGTTGGWIYYEFRVADKVTPTALIKLRFIASDYGTASLVEAALDDFMITQLQCGCGYPADGDMNGDLVVNGSDIAVFVGAMLNGGTIEQVCHGDFSGLNSLDVNDIPGMVNALLSAP